MSKREFSIVSILEEAGFEQITRDSSAREIALFEARGRQVAAELLATIPGFQTSDAAASSFGMGKDELVTAHERILRGNDDRAQVENQAITRAQEDEGRIRQAISRFVSLSSGTRTWGVVT